MIVINKKRIQIIISCLIISVFAFTYQIANKDIKTKENLEDEGQNSVTTTATPVSGKTIVLDAGHRSAR